MTTHPRPADIGLIQSTTRSRLTNADTKTTGRSRASRYAVILGKMHARRNYENAETIQ